MPSALFWSLTEREYNAHKRVFDGREKQRAYAHADLQVTLHNAWFKRRDDPERPFAIDEFLPEALRPPRRMKSGAELLAVFQAFAESLAPKTG